MTKESLIDLFNKNHEDFLKCITSLTDSEFVNSKSNKWTPGQQLDHIYLCLQPLAQAVNSKALIEQKFGTIKRITLNYDEVISRYKNALESGGKAPEKFVPGKVESDHKIELMNSCRNTLKAISTGLNTYAEEELDSLVLPHPLLGILTIREMFYLMAFHATHHLNQTKGNLTT